jgi:hypothetical protein
MYTIQYMGGAPVELPLPADPGTILFLFLSSASAMAFINVFWLMAALTNSMYDKLANCIRCSYRWMVSPAWYRLAFFSSMSMWYDPVLSKSAELPRVVEHTMVPLLKV